MGSCDLIWTAIVGSCDHRTEGTTPTFIILGWCFDHLSNWQLMKDF